jgi:hypothetical protein
MEDITFERNRTAQYGNTLLLNGDETHLRELCITEISCQFNLHLNRLLDREINNEASKTQ